jgi:hypothetical protein
MIQLIGFLLCTYMLVRGLDMWSRIEDRKSRGAVALAMAAIVIAIVGSGVFFLLLIAQGAATPNLNSPNF